MLDSIPGTNKKTKGMIHATAHRYELEMGSVGRQGTTHHGKESSKTCGLREKYRGRNKGTWSADLSLWKQEEISRDRGSRMGQMVSHGAAESSLTCAVLQPWGYSKCFKFGIKVSFLKRL
jgi:hypothetical protein